MSSGSNPTTLSSLQRHSPQQNARIKAFSRQSRSYYLKNISTTDKWLGFWKSVWGKQDVDSLDRSERVNRGPDPIDDSLIFPDVIPSSCVAMAKPPATNDVWNFDCENILVRSEYKEAEEVVLSACATRDRALVVIGQPGTGKSVFLLRILLRRLALQLPTALQVTPSYALLFFSGGVKELSRLDDGPPYNVLLPEDRNPLGRIWALVDCDRAHDEPAMVFQQGPFFVIKASPPHPMHHQWTRRIYASFFHMKPWSFAEVLQVHSLNWQDTSEQNLWYLHNKYGASLRDLCNFANHLGRYDEIIDYELDQLSHNDPFKRLCSIANSTDDSPRLFSTGPLPTNRALPERKFVSSYVLEQIFRKVFRNQVEETRRFYEKSLRFTTTAIVAGMIFEHEVHRLLHGGIVLNLSPILSSGLVTENITYDNYTSTIDTKTFVLPKLTDSTLAGGINVPLDPGTYYHPRGFPTINSWVLTQPAPQGTHVLLRFQITTNEGESGVEKDSLEMVDKAVEERIKKYLVVITPTGVKPRINVPRGYLVVGRQPDKAFPVYHLEISPDELF